MLNKIPPEKTEILDKIKKFSCAKRPVSKKDFLSLISGCVEVLENEVTDYRKPVSISDEVPGGLVDFTGKKGFDVIVVPDLHARKELIYKLLSYGIDEKTGESVFERLCSGKLLIIFLGDILHSESDKKERWLKAYDEYSAGNALSEQMTEEMTDGLATLCQVMILKKAFPEIVHCLKGNHENIKNENSGGNFAFRKFVDEGSMVYDFMSEKYGDKIVNAIYKFELLLPVMASFDDFLISHAEPLKSYSKEEVIDSVIKSEVVYGLTWTRNGDVKTETAGAMFDSICKKNRIEKKYITGHRPVKGKFNLRQNGDVVQIHNPHVMQFAYIKNGDGFNPENDIYEL